jgi:hypothetical protein
MNQENTDPILDETVSSASPVLPSIYCAVSLCETKSAPFSYAELATELAVDRPLLTY